MPLTACELCLGSTPNEHESSTVSSKLTFSKLENLDFYERFVFEPSPSECFNTLNSNSNFQQFNKIRVMMSGNFWRPLRFHKLQNLGHLLARIFEFTNLCFSREVEGDSEDQRAAGVWNECQGLHSSVWGQEGFWQTGPGSGG